MSSLVAIEGGAISLALSEGHVHELLALVCLM